MKRNVFALLLAVMMIVSCMTLFVNAADAAKAGYVPAASVPTIDGKANELVWNSVDAIDGVKVLWGDTGFYFLVDADATIKVTEAEGATEQVITVADGVVSAPNGAEVAGKEIFLPFNYYTKDNKAVWTWFGFVQERTQGDHEDIFGAYKTKTTITVNYKADDGNGNLVAADHQWEIRQAIAGSKGDYKCPTTQANDLMGLKFTMNGKAVEFAGPYGQTCMMNGAELGELTWWDDSQITGVSRANRELIAPNADFQVKENSTGIELYTIDLSEDHSDLAGQGYYALATTYTSDGKPLPRYGWMPAQPAFAAKVSADNAPVVDGIIDAVWETTAKIYHYNEIDDPLWSSYGYVSVLWSDDGLYYLGSVVDTALAYSGTGMDDHININITETWGGKDAPSSYCADKASMTQYGEYWFGIDPLGRFNDGSAVCADATYAGSIWADGKGYNIEAYVPFFTLTADTAKIGHVMGLESSVDDFRDPNGIAGRDEYTNLGGLSSYWSNPQSQFKVVFVGELDYANEGITMADVNALINTLAEKAQMKADALTADAVDMMISDYVDSALEDIDLSEYATVESLADYAKKSDIKDVDLSDYAKKSDIKDVDLSEYAKTADIKSSPLPVILAIAAIVVAAAGIVLQFVKKK